VKCPNSVTRSHGESETTAGLGEVLWFTCFGLRMGVQSADPGTLAQFAVRAPAAWRPARSGCADRLYSLTWDAESACHVLTLGPHMVHRATSLDVVLDALEIDARHFVAQFARRSVFVHAGSVAVAGRAVVIPGRSGTGKSTMVAALLRRGATYYSDEYAVFDQRGRVRSYPKPLSLRVEASSAALAGFGPSNVHRRPTLPLGAVVSGCFTGVNTTWRPRTESAGHAMMALLDNTVAIRRQPAMSLAFLARALGDVVVLVGPRGDAGEAAENLLGFLDRHWR